MEFLSDQWCSAVADLAAGVDVGFRDGQVDLVVTGAPGGKAQLTATFTDGALQSLGAGTGTDENRVILTTVWREAEAIARGDRVASVAFMLGTLKTEGPTGPLLEVLRVIDAGVPGDAWRELCARTAFG